MKAAFLLALMVTLASCATPGDGRSSGNGARRPLDVVIRLTSQPDAPNAVLTVGSSVQKGQLGSYCWSSAGVGMCADAVLTLPTSYVAVPRGALLRIEGEADDLGGSLGKPKRREDIPDLEYVHELDLSDGTDTLDARPGKYVLDLFTQWEQGDASFTFGIRILRPK